MGIEITARHEHIGTELQNHARARAEAIQKDFAKTGHVHVVLEVEGHRYRAEFIVDYNGAQCVGVAEHPENMVTSIDDASEKVTRQIRKMIDKRVASRHAGGGKA